MSISIPIGSVFGLIDTANFPPPALSVDQRIAQLSDLITHLNSYKQLDVAARIVEIQPIRKQLDVFGVSRDVTYELTDEKIEEFLETCKTEIQNLIDYADIVHRVLEQPSLIFELTKVLQHTEEQHSFFEILKKIAYTEATRRCDFELCKKLVDDEPGQPKVISEFISKVGRIVFVDYEGLPEPCDRDTAQILAWTKPEMANPLAILFPDDKFIVLAAVKQDGEALKSVSKRLSDDTNIVLAAVHQSGYALKYASDRLKDNKNIALAAVQEDGEALKYVSKNLKDDTNIVLAAVHQSGHALKYASDSLKDNENIALAAVQEDGEALKYVSKKLGDYESIVLAAVHQSGYALKHASRRLKGDRNIALVAVKENGKALKYVSKILRNDKDVILAAVRERGKALKYAKKRWKDYEEVVIEAVKENGTAIDFVSDRLKDFARKIIAESTEAFFRSVQSIVGPFTQVTVYGFHSARYKKVIRKLQLENSPFKRVYDWSNITEKMAEGHMIERVPVEQTAISKSKQTITRTCKSGITELLLENYKRKKTGLPIIPLLFCVESDIFHQYTPYSVSAKDEFVNNLITNSELRRIYKHCTEFAISDNLLFQELTEIAHDTVKFVSVHAPDDTLSEVMPIWEDPEFRTVLDDRLSHSKKVRQEEAELKQTKWREEFVSRAQKVKDSLLATSERYEAQHAIYRDRIAQFLSEPEVSSNSPVQDFVSYFRKRPDCTPYDEQILSDILFERLYSQLVNELQDPAQ